MKIIILYLIICNKFFLSTNVLAYSKVSKYGQGRSGSQDVVAFTVSPIHNSINQRTTTVDLKPGEVVNHPSTPKYFTLDEQFVSQLDSSNLRKKPQERFNPPANFEHLSSHANAMKNYNRIPIVASSSSSSNKNIVYSKPSGSMPYDYPTTVLKTSFPSYAAPFPDSYPIKESSSDQLILNVKPPTIYESNDPPKTIEYLPYDDQQSSHYHHSEDDEIIYDHVPDDDHHYFYHDYHNSHRHKKKKKKPMTSTTEQPEPMDQRLNRRPYSYYYIGRKLWYVPLYFSIYFIIYIAALVLKSIARHKINFPTQLAAAGNSRMSSKEIDTTPGWLDYVGNVLEAIDYYGRTNFL